MSQYQQRDNSGTAFVNDKKQTDRHPDFKGKAMIGGVMYFFDIWKKPTRNGGNLLSASFKKMDKQPQDRGEESQDIDNDPF